MTRRARFRTTPLVLGSLALAAAAGLSACSSSKKPSAVQTATAEAAMDSARRLAEAQRLAAQAQQMRDPVKAIATYQQAVNTYPEFGPAWNNLGVLLMDQQRFLEAAQAFGAASEYSPSDPRPLYNLGLAWERAGYAEDAFENYVASLNRDARFLPALRGAIRSERLMDRGDETTLERIRLALLQEPDQRWREYFMLQRSLIEYELLNERPGMYPTRPQSRTDLGSPRTTPPSEGGPGPG